MAASWGRRGISRTAARVFGATRRGGRPRRPRASWWRTWTTPAAKSTSPQLSASTSEKRMPVAIEGRQQRPVAHRRRLKQAGELAPAEDALIGGSRVRPLVRVQPPQRIARDIAAPDGEVEHTAQWHEQTVDRPSGESRAAQLGYERGEIVGSDQLQPT